MRLAWCFVLLVSVCACSGLYSKVDGGGGGGGGGEGGGGGDDAGVGGGGGGVGGGVGGGGGGAGGGGTGGGGCSLPEHCPAPVNSSPVCTNAICSFVCTTPFFHCANSCCTATAIAAGEAHTCIITSEGGVKCWGNTGTAGDGTFLLRNTPTDVQGLTSKAVELTAGSGFTCARLDTGEVQCWGIQTIGNGAAAPAATAKAISLTTPVSRVSAGGSHACVVADGGAYCWGNDTFGQQGTNGGGPRLSPGNVSGLVYDVTQIAQGYTHGCAVLADAGALCWGYNAAGECGDGTIVKRTVPVIVTASDAGIVELLAGFNFTCARTTSGGVSCWGTNGAGECGYGVQSGRTLIAEKVLGITAGLTQLGLGSASQHACVVQDGGVFCWGEGANGRLGDGNVGKQLAPVRALGITVPIARVAPGGAHTCAITIEGGVLCWGDNTEGQIGDGTTGGQRLSPVKVR